MSIETEMKLSLLNVLSAEKVVKLENDFALADARVQFLDNPEGVVHGEFSAVLKQMLSLDELKNMCEKIAVEFGGQLYGTVNMDFFGSNYSFDMAIEFQ